jgi:hypothetical protein
MISTLRALYKWKASINHFSENQAEALSLMRNSLQLFFSSQSSAENQPEEHSFSLCYSLSPKPNQTKKKQALLFPWVVPASSRKTEHKSSLFLFSISLSLFLAVSVFTEKEAHSLLVSLCIPGQWRRKEENFWKRTLHLAQ